MPTFQELERALINADKAGDKEAATILARELRHQISLSKTEVEPEVKQPEPEPETGFIAGAKASFQRLLGDIEAAKAAGNIEGAEQKAKEYREAAAKIYKQPELLEAPWEYLKGLAGQSAVYMAAPVAAGLAASAAAPAAIAGLAATGATFLTSALQFSGSNLSRQLEENVSAKDLKVLNAVAASIPQAALDTVSLRMVPGLRNIFAKAGVELGEKEAAQLAKESLVISMAKGVPKTAGVEGLTESAQQVFERAQAGLSLTDEQARKEYFDNFIGGALLGGAIAVPGTVYEKGKAQAEVAAKEAEAERAAQTAKEEAAKIGQTAVPDPVTGQVPPPAAPAPLPTFEQRPPGAVSTPDEFAAAEAQLDALTTPPPLPPAKKKDETPEEAMTRYEAELAAGKDASGKTITEKHRNSIEKKLAKLKETVDVTESIGVDTTGAEPSVISPASGVGAPAAGAEAPATTGVVPTGGPATTTAVAEGAQPTTLKGAPSVTETPEAKQAEAQRPEKAAPAPIDQEVLRLAYENQAKEAANLGFELPAWDQLSEAERVALTEEVQAERATKGMLPAKGEAKVGFLSPAMAAIIKSRIDQKIDSGEIDLTRAPQPVIDLYEEEREDWGERNAVRTSTWNELSTDEKAIYLDNIKRNTIEERNNAFDILADYRDAKKSKVAPRGASFYETNRAAYNKYLPAWIDLNDTEREAFLKAIEPGLGAPTAKPKVSTEQMDAGFKAVVEQVNKRLEEKAKKETEKKTTAEKKAAEERARIQKEKSGEVEVGERLEGGVKEKKAAPTFEPFSAPPLPESAAELRKLLKNMVNKGSAINTKLVEELLGESTNAGVLSALARGDVNEALAALERAKGMRLTEFGGYRFEGLELFENRYKAISQALFRHLAKTLNKINFASSEVVLEGLEPNNAIIAQLKREGKLAAYDPKTDTFYFTNDGLDEQTVLHEIVHAGTVKILYTYKTNPNSLTQEEREAAEHIDKIYEFAKSKLGNKPRYANAFENVFEFVSYALTDPTFQGELASMQAPSLNKYTKPTPGLNLNNLWSQFTKAMMALYNLFKPKATTLQLKDELYPAQSREFYAVQLKSDKIKLQYQNPKELAKIYKKASNNKIKDESSHPWDGWFPSKGVSEVIPTQLLTKQSGYQSNVLLEFTEAFKNILAEPEAGIDIEALPAKQAKPPIAAPAEGSTSINELRDTIPSPSFNARNVVKTFNLNKFVEGAIRIFQNDRAAIKNWQRRMWLTGRYMAYGIGFNNIYDQITLSSGNAHWLYTQYVQEDNEAVRKGVVEYAKARKLDVDTALKELGMYAIALHEEERRETLYLRTVDLTESETLTNTVTGKPISPRAARDAIFDYLDSHKLDLSGATYLRAQLDKIVNDKSNLGKDAKPRDDQMFAVAGYTSEQIKTIKADYDKHKADADKVLNRLKAVNKATLELNAMANYMSEYANNYIMFYGYENYVPFKGKHFNEDKADIFNHDGRKLGGDFQEDIHTFEGRLTVPDNPILQVMADGAKSAMRAGRKDVTQAIYNAVKEGSLAGEIMKFGKEGETKKDYVDFKDRANDDLLQQLKGETKIFHYMPDGKVAIIQINDKNQREAIRRTYRDTNPAVDFMLNKMNTLTGIAGQMHTRYKLTFAPVNFVRDVLTNAWAMGAEGKGLLGPLQSFRYLSAIALNIVKGDMFRSWNFVRLYSKGDTKKIEALAKTDAYYKDLMDYVKTGGKVSYIQGIAPKGQLDELLKTPGGKLFDTSKIQRFFDIWIDTFEMTSRTTAFRIAKADEVAKLSKKGDLSKAEVEKAATTTAAAYAKNLANFEQVGEWGRALGGLFMFYRPSATGAVRAMDAVAPAFQRKDRVKLSLPEFAEAAQIREKLKGDVTDTERKKLEAKLAKLDDALNEFDKNYGQLQTSSRIIMGALAGAGIVTYMMAQGSSDDDDLGRNRVSTDDMARWTKFARFHIPGMETPIQLPWGFGLGAFAALGSQLAALGDGRNPTKTSEIMGNMLTITLDSFMPLPFSRIPITEAPGQFALDSVLPSVVRPLFEYYMNMDALGHQIYNNRQSKFGDAYTGGDNIPEAYKFAAQRLAEATNGAINWSPNTMYFFFNNYADGVAALVNSPVNMALWMSGKKDFNAHTDTMFLDSFFGTRSNFDARQWSKIEADLKDRAEKINMFKADPVQYAEYLAKHPFDAMLTKMYNGDVNGRLKELREDANKWRTMRGLDIKTRTELVKNAVLQQNLLKYSLIQKYKAFGIEP